MQNIYAPGQSDRVDGSIRITGVTFHDLENSRTAEASQWLRIGVLSALLGHIERKPIASLTSSGKEERSVLALPIQTTGLMLIEAVILILCLKEHRKQGVIFVDGKRFWEQIGNKSGNKLGTEYPGTG